MAGLEIHKEPEYAYRRTAPVAAAATALFVTGDPVGLTAQQLHHSIDDDTIILDEEIVGFACEPATGTTAGSRGTTTADGFGAVTNDDRAYWPVNAPGLEIRTRNFWATGAPGTAATPDAANIGHDYNIVGRSGLLTYGVEETAATPADDVVAVIVDVLDANMRPINVTGETGVWVVFSPRGVATQDVAGQ